MTPAEILAALPSPLRETDGAAMAYAHGLADLVAAGPPDTRPPRAIVAMWARGGVPLFSVATQLQRPIRDQVAAQAALEQLG